MIGKLPIFGRTGFHRHVQTISTLQLLKYNAVENYMKIKIKDDYLPQVI